MLRPTSGMVVVLSLVLLYVTQQHQQIAGAASRAQARTTSLEREVERLESEARHAHNEARRLRQRHDLEQRACSASAAALAPAAVRAAVREALRAMADAGGADEEAGGAAGLLADQAELVRAELAEGLALEDAGWLRSAVVETKLSVSDCEDKLALALRRLEVVSTPPPPPLSAGELEGRCAPLVSRAQELLSSAIVPYASRGVMSDEQGVIK
ncbi:hypothetical protein EMIHUDRAFT_225178 [Emiliania huxleyi CCMP1516]|uniref:Uncharacterized protein n=2 Tax=Emiliania huxleyi TaxID=2903 RepID=A0A0D3KPD9_EMIH1|nr:hypothetical protein EMIHUDRAFT_221578 [Emiliania huxleyi CCMP1516]XP_005790053.1 hypothetical protein EMIHUDRAFT_225178 [Emiliania huxleyi CCMP1516]EOD04121.1 hypothetical protein EMIHUDRAFT_221578 [Emiliania huxleyi CCMP1516]EOD37624.1 hypothetical protein EMIHUDRAFT_225178 [Emiliania huxleyi CCMP1516]|eukprot:XP_005756550.1 hypothetical protein EMIHUDRAFT_221578 [Emiliania huxleyi CCMP1516]